MERQRVFIWTGGQPQGPEDWERAAADALPVLPDPAPLQRAALIEYYWGAAKFVIVATACSVRTTPWGDRQVTWLHCKARPVTEAPPDESVNLMTVLFPAAYVTGIKPGPTFRLRRSGRAEDLGLFPPSHPAPAGALPLAEVERVITRLLAAERN